jgi:uroporphyrinogen decarboxylase
MNLTTEALIAFSKAQLLAGADVVQCGDSLASLDMISPEIYRKYAFPYEKMFFEAIRPFARAHQAYSLLHICGDNTKVMDLQAQTGADILEIDSKAELKTWKNAVGDRVILMGNLDPTRVLLQGSVGQVRESCQACLDDAAAGGGYILGSGCEVPMQAPAANLQAMVASAKAYRRSGR